MDGAAGGRADGGARAHARRLIVVAAVARRCGCGADLRGSAHGRRERARQRRRHRAPRSGPLIELHVADNQPVKPGDLLFVIDPRPYRPASSGREPNRAHDEGGGGAAERGGRGRVEIPRRQADLAAAEATLPRRDRPGALDAEIARLEAELARRVASARLGADSVAEDYCARGAAARPRVRHGRSRPGGAVQAAGARRGRAGGRAQGTRRGRRHRRGPGASAAAIAA